MATPPPTEIAPPGRDARPTALDSPPRRTLLRRGRRVAEQLVVIGNGPASFKLCERLAHEGGLHRFRLTILGEEPHAAYDRIHLTRRLEGSLPQSLSLASREWYSDRGITLITGDPAVAVDRPNRTVRSASGRLLPYDRLVFATGSRAFRPPIPGAELPGVFLYRTLDDLEAVLQRASIARRAAVIGGGLLGLEAARALLGLGLQTWIIERGISLLARQLDPQAGRILQQDVERLGIRVLTARDTERIESLDNDLLVQFRDGECLRVQLAILAAGIRPRDELASACGLQLGPRGGIDVDDSLRSSDPSIYAIGECASHRGTVHGLAAPAYHMAETLAGILLGRRLTFAGADASTWLKVPGLAVATLGDYQAETETLTVQPPGGYRRLLIRKGRLVGAVAVGDWPEQRWVHEAIHLRRRVWRWQKARFLRSARLLSPEDPTPVSDWPASALVCNCLSIRRGALAVAMDQGHRTLESLAQFTGASTVCGSCRPLLAELLGAPAQPRRFPGRRALLLSAVAAIALGMVIAFVDPVPLTDTVQRSWNYDALWRNPVIRQITGFSLLGLILAGLLFSARKRVRRFTHGEVGRWRALHAALGALSVIALTTHTGLRLGQNLNFVLMLDFLALAVVGGAAGMVTALEHRMTGPGGRRLRAAWNLAHLLLTWPLPALIFFHVLTSYYF